MDVLTKHFVQTLIIFMLMIILGITGVFLVERYGSKKSPALEAEVAK